MQTAHELFIHELTDMLSAEQQLVEALQEQEEAASNSQLKKAFASHRAQTEKQVQRLEKCFEEIGEEAEETECKGIAGLIEEYKSFKDEEDPTEDILDCFAVGAAIKVESYEIHAYESLIDLAESMGHDKAAKLLGQSLKEEEATREKLESLSEKLKPKNLGMEEGEEEEPSGAEMEVEDEEEMQVGAEEDGSRISARKSASKGKKGGRKAA
jgi:ferritin-like metal-binding protein YciE